MFVKLGGHMVVAQAVVVAAVAHFACTLKVHTHTHTEALFTTVWGEKKEPSSHWSNSRPRRRNTCVRASGAGIRPGFSPAVADRALDLVVAEKNS